MQERIERKLDEIEAEWEEPFADRLLKVTVLAVAGLASAFIAELLYDKARDHIKRDDDVIEATAELTE